ncbi:MAG: phosphoenolpyruvate carboxykinase (ATP) [Dysosmobacter sp.]
MLAPISQGLDEKQAMHYFDVRLLPPGAGRVRSGGITSPVPAFSTCFGAPFMPPDPSVYAEDAKAEKVVARRPARRVYLVNTGRRRHWQSGWSSSHTRAMVTAALNGERRRRRVVTASPFLAQAAPHKLSPHSCREEPMIPATSHGSDKAAIEAKSQGLWQRSAQWRTSRNAE